MVYKLFYFRNGIRSLFYSVKQHFIAYWHSFNTQLSASHGNEIYNKYKKYKSDSINNSKYLVVKNNKNTKENDLK